MTVLEPRLFEVHQHELTSDDYYTPAWVFERMGIEFDLDVCSPPGGIPWIPAARYFDMADDGLAQPWEGRVWMNPPFSHIRRWAERWVEHRDGICLVPFSRTKWFARVWEEADGVCSLHVPSFVGGEVNWPLIVAAFGEECVEAIGRLGKVRR